MGRHNDLLLGSAPGRRRSNDLLLTSGPPSPLALKRRSLRGRLELSRIDWHTDLLVRSGRLPGVKQRPGLAFKGIDLAGEGSLEPNGRDTFTVYAAVFGNVDHQGDIIEAGAFRNVEDFVEDGVVLINHDIASLPVATIERATQDDYGLRCEARWHSTPEARAARTIVKERLGRGKSVGASIGYEVLEAHEEYLAEAGRVIRVITALDVHEFSLVNVPANALAGVIA